MRYIILICMLYSLNALAVTINKQTAAEPRAGFVENRGQLFDQTNKTNWQVLYLLNTPGLNVQIRKTGFSYDTYVREKKVKTTDELKKNNEGSDDDGLLKAAENFDIEYRFHRVDVELLGITSNEVKIYAEQPNQEMLNYYNIPGKEEGILNVRSFQKILVKNIYKGIDVEYVIENGNFKYNFIVHPGADYKQIRLQYNGAPVELEKGVLKFALAQGTLEERIPQSWYGKPNQKNIPVAIKYSQLEKGIFGFTGIEQDKNQTLVIDPNPRRLWGTYCGGNNDESYNASIVTDASGNIYLSAVTSSTTGIATSGTHQTTFGGGSFDGFLTKFNSNGVRQWATYYGGSGIEDYNVYCAADTFGNIYISGLTTSAAGIATGSGHQTTHGGGTYDVFLVKFNGGGIRQWGTYYGGSGTETGRVACATDLSGNVYLSGFTTSTSGIASSGAHQEIYGGGAYDAFLVKMDSGGVRQWATYYGGEATESIEMSCATDASGNVYIAGFTNSAGGIATGTAHQATNAGGTNDIFLAKMNANGVCQWGTFYGGSGAESFGVSCVADTFGKVYLSGISNSTSGISTSGTHQPVIGGSYDAFLVQFYAINGMRHWGTYYGGTSNELYDVSCIKDLSGNVYLSGFSTSSTGIASPNAYQAVLGGGYDAFLAKIDSIGIRQWGTYYGGTASEVNVVSCAIDGTGGLYLAGVTNSTAGIASPSGAHQSALSGSSDGFLVKFQECADPFPGNPAAITAPSPSTVCAGVGRTFTLSSPVTGAAGYMWSVPAGWTIIGGQGTMAVQVIPSATGTISVKAYNNCGDSSITPASLLVTVTAAPTKPSTITTSQGQLVNGIRTFCNASSATFNVTTGSGVNYQWLIPAGWIGSSTTSAISTTVGTTSDTLRVIAKSSTNGCPSDTQKLYVRSFQIPLTPTGITGNAIVCVGKQNVFVADSMPFATSYTWTYPTGWTRTTSRTDTMSVLLTPNTNIGDITVLARNFCGVSSTKTLSITLNTSVPSQPGTMTGITPVCGNLIQNYSVPFVSSSIKYRWVLPTGWVIRSGDSTNQITVLTGATSGTFNISAYPYKDSNYVCEGPARTMSVTVQATPAKPGLISGDTTVCASTSAGSYTISSVAGATSYLWTLPSGWTGTSTTTSISVTAGSVAGDTIIRVKALTGTCMSFDTFLAIKVSPALGAISSIAGNATMCAGSLQSYSLPAVTNANAYTWTLPVGWTAVGKSDSNVINVVVGSSGTTVSVKAINPGCTSTNASLPVTITNSPSKPSTITTSQGQLVNGIRTLCNATPATFSVNTIAGVSYEWSLPSGWAGTSTTSSISTTVGAINDTIRVIAKTTVNSCPSDTQKLYVQSFQAPATPTGISGNATVCVSKPNVFVSDSMQYATSYTWTYPTGWSRTTSRTDTMSVVLTPNTTLGNITVLARNFCGASTAKTLTVNTSTTVPAQPSTISGLSSPCGNASQVYSVTATAGLKYKWILPAGWSIVSGDSTNQITVLTGSTGGTIRVAAFQPANPVCEGVERTLAVSIAAAPAKPGLISGDTTVCASSSAGSYIIGSVSGATSYEWTLPTGWTVAGGLNTTNITLNAGPVTGNVILKVKAMTGGCASPDTSLAITVSPALGSMSTITGGSTVCTNSTQKYSITAVSNATSYTWSFPSGWTVVGRSDSNVINLTIGGLSGPVSVIATNKGCMSASPLFNVTPTSAPAKPGSITAGSGTCVGNTVTFTTPLVAGLTYTWTKNSGWSGSSTTNSINITLNSTSDTLRVIAVATGGCFSPEQKLYVAVATPPAAPATISGATTACAGTNEVFRISKVTGASSYQWTYPSGWSGSTSTTDTFVTVTVGTNAGVVSVKTYSSATQCTSAIKNSANVSVGTVTPPTPSTISGSNSFCVNVAKPYSIAAVTGATGYIWTVPTGWVINSGQNTTSITVTPSSTTGAVTVQAVQTGCKSGVQSLSAFNVLNKPAATTITPGQNENCVGGSTTMSCNAVADASSYLWSVPSGWTINSGQNGTLISVAIGNAGGSVTVIPKNDGCNGSTSTKAVAVTTAPVVVNGIGGEQYVKSFSIRKYYLAGVTGNVTYNWQVPAGWNIIKGQNEDTITVLTGSTNGTISVQISNSCGGTFKSMQVFSGVSSAMAEQLSFANLTVAPVPANDQLTLTLTPLEKSNLDWRIVNMLGQEVLNGILGELPANMEHQSIIDVSGLPAGVYQLYLFNSSNSSYSKISISR